MHNLDLILTLTGALAAALAFGYVTQRLGLSPIVGYLLAGVAVGPNTPGFVANKDLAAQCAEIGVVLLMFGVGLQFHFSELLRVRRVAVPGAIGQSAVATILGCLLGLAFGWGWSAGVVFGLAISVASTVVLLRVLSDNHALHMPAGHIAVGWLVVEDLFTVVVLVLLPVLVDPAAEGTRGAFVALGMVVVKIATLIAFVVFAGSRVIPWILARISATRSRELFTLTIMVVALGVAVGAAKVFGLSMALGAFLAGMVVGRSDFSSRAAAEAVPMRDAFAVLFFVSVGMLFDPAHLLAAPGLVVATLGIVIVGKPLAAFVIVRALGHPPRIGLAVAVALAQIGEFSFILASIGADLGILPEEATNSLIAAALVSISVNPVLFRLLGPIEARVRVSRLLSRWWTFPSEPRAAAAGDGSGAVSSGAIVVGGGPVGRTVARLLSDNGVRPTVIELNLETVRLLRSQGIRAVYGDASHTETLHEAGLADAVALVLSSSTLHSAAEVIRTAKDANPGVRVLARASYLLEVAPLRRAGADAVFAAEGEVALTMTEFVLRMLGATSEQIDRERDRVRGDLFDGPPANNPPLVRSPPRPSPDVDAGA